MPAAPSVPNGDAADEVAVLLAGAENPLIITSSAGRDPKSWSALAQFAERYALPVIQYRNRYMSLPSNHPMNLGYELKPLLDGADVILAVDVPVPWLPAYDKVRDASRHSASTSPVSGQMRAVQTPDALFFATHGDMSDLLIFVQEIDELKHIDVRNTGHQVDARLFQAGENLSRSSGVPTSTIPQLFFLLKDSRCRCQAVTTPALD